MMRVICLLLVSLFALKVNAQQYTKFNGYGFAADRMRSDSISIHPSDTVRNKAARSIAVLNGVFYIADGTKWKVVGTDTTSLSNRINLKLNIADTSAMLNPYLRKVDTATLSNRINLKLNIADTVNKWVTNVYKVNDSTIAVLKNGTTSNIVLNPAATKLVTTVYNNSGSTITKGSVVYINGRHSSNLPTIALAIGNNEENSYKTFALVQDDILPSNSGVVIQAGKIENLNLPTSQFTDGDIVYLSPTVPGGITITKPLAPFHICKIGSVTRAHPTFGSIEIKIENGWQLDELSDVQIAAVPLDSTILQFSRVDSLWHDVNPTTAMGNRFIKPTDTATMLNPYTRGSGTSGQIGYWNATRSLTGSSNLFWDNANGRLGIGTSSPQNTFDVVRGTAGAMLRSQYESASFSFNADSKVGIYTASSNTAHGASLIFGQTNLQASSAYPAFEMQYVYSATVADNNWRLNYTGRSSSGLVTTFAANLFNVYADGRVILNPAASGVTASAKLLIGTSTDAGFRLDVNGTARVQSTLKVGAATTQNASAVLDVESTTRGFLPPRMTTAQRDLIATPAAGLIIYNTSTNTHQGYNGTTWNNFY